MYYPYLRGKQNELIVLRENASLLAKASFVPILEPVKSTLNGLRRTLDAISDEQGEVIVIVNPSCGDFSKDGSDISNFIEDEYSENENILVGILLSKNAKIENILELYEWHKDSNDIALIHSGFSEGKELSARLGEEVKQLQHIFIEKHCGKLYRRHFVSDTRILIRDGFIKTKNSSYPDLEFFSDLHITFDEEGVNGFGDFLIVSDEYSESGGPAYAIAIHLTCIDETKDDEMHVHHFISIRRDSPTDPAGKFAEALTKLIDEIDSANTQILETKAIKAFRDLDYKSHFPGLGYVKKLSMQHHIETLAIYLED